MKKLIVTAFIAISLLVVGGIVLWPVISLLGPVILLMVVTAPHRADDDRRNADLLARIEAGDKNAVAQYARRTLGRPESEQFLRKHAVADEPEVQVLLAQRILQNGCRTRDGVSSCNEAITLLEPLARERCKLESVNLPIKLAEAYDRFDVEKADLWFGIALEHCGASKSNSNDYSVVKSLLSIDSGGKQDRARAFSLWLSQTGFYDAHLAELEIEIKTDKARVSIYDPNYELEQAQIARNDAANLALDKNLVARLNALKQRVIESKIKPKL
jgi:hypothetical protein